MNDPLQGFSHLYSPSEIARMAKDLEGKSPLEMLKHLRKRLDEVIERLERAEADRSDTGKRRKQGHP